MFEGIKNANKPESYPFLRISRQYNVPYENVLKVADWFQHRDKALGLRIPDNVLYFVDRMPSSCLRDIRIACSTMDKIRDGHIDWLSGDTINGENHP